MKSYQNKNLHIPHIEDLVLLKRDEGLKWIISVFKWLYKKSFNYNINDFKISIKMDGSPAIYCFSDFYNLGKNGIATKSMFIKEPKILYTEKDILKYYEDRPNLIKKLSCALEYIPYMNIPKNEIWQGDYLFDQNSLHNLSLSNKEFLYFHPNTIIYCAKNGSKQYEEIKNSKLGVAWHTIYKGSDLNDCKASYCIDLNRSHNDIFVFDPYIKNIDISNEDRNLIEDILKIIINKEINLSFLDKSIVDLLMRFENEQIKNSQKLDLNTFYERFPIYITEQFEKEISNKKTVKGKEFTKIRMKYLLDITEKEEFKSILFLLINIIQLKEIFIKTLNKNKVFETYVKTKEGDFKKVGHEGFVISDKCCNSCKLVNRSEFSRYNFDNNIEKGWEK